MYFLRLLKKRFQVYFTFFKSTNLVRKVVLQSYNFPCLSSETKRMMRHSGEGRSIFCNFTSNSQRTNSNAIVIFLVKPKSKFFNLPTNQKKLTKTRTNNLNENCERAKCEMSRVESLSGWLV